MSESALELVDFLAMSDDELMSMSNQEFADALINKAEQFGLDMLDKNNYRLHPISEKDRHRALIEWNQRHAWMEWWLGVPPPSRQILALGEEDMGLRILLAQQIIDEVKHQRVFTRRVNQLGGDARLENYRPSPLLRHIYDITYEFEDPLEIAASLQTTGEATLGQVMGNPERSILTEALDEETRRLMATEVNLDEPRHVRIGRQLTIKYADTPEKRRRMAEIQKMKLEALAEHYLIEHESFGAERIAPLPIV